MNFELNLTTKAHEYFQFNVCCEYFFLWYNFISFCCEYFQFNVCFLQEYSNNILMLFGSMSREDKYFLIFNFFRPPFFKYEIWDFYLFCIFKKSQLNFSSWFPAHLHLAKTSNNVSNNSVHYYSRRVGSKLEADEGRDAINLRHFSTNKKLKTHMFEAFWNVRLATLKLILKRLDFKNLWLRLCFKYGSSKWLLMHFSLSVPSNEFKIARIMSL